MGRNGSSPRQDYEVLFTVTMRRSVFVSSGQVNYLQNISVGHHVLQSDEPSDTGGKDAAPDPHELLLASLGACTSITAQMYAARKKWPLEGMHVNLSWSTETIEMEISFVGDLSEDQQQRLLEVANRFPISSCAQFASAYRWQTVRQSYEPVLTVGLNVLSSNLLASSSSCRLIVWGIPG